MKLLLFALLIITGTCVYGQSPYDEVQTIRFDPQQAFGGDVSELIDSVQYIPLETTKESTFGAITNLQVNDRYFVFFDADTKAIYVFSKGGKFVGKINKLPVDGWDKSDFYPFSQFTFDKKNDDIYVIFNDRKAHRKWLLLFNVTGHFIRKIDFTGIGKSFADRFAPLDDGSFLFSNTLAFHPLDEQAYFYKIRHFNSLGEPVLSIFKDDIFLKRDASRGYMLSCYSGNTSVWNRKCEYSFLVLNGNKAIRYDIIFPVHMVLDSSKYKDASFFNKIETVWEYCKENKIIEELSAIGLSGDLLIFKKLAGGGSNMSDNFILSLQSKRFYSFDHITSDEKSYFLPVGNVEVSAFEKGVIYNEVASFQMFDAAKERLDKPWDSDAALSTYFNNADRNSNPVIVALKLKDNL